MRTRAGEPVHLQARMVDRVEVPQEGNFVERAMHPVADEIDEEQDLEELQNQRLCGDRLLEIELDRPRERNLYRNHRRERDELHAGVADEEMLDVGLPARAEDLLLAQRPDPL